MLRHAMILRFSSKLSKKLGFTPQESMLLCDNPYLDWSGHLFRANRIQHIILTNTPTLYSLLFLGLGITSQAAYEEKVRNELLAYLRYDWNESIFSRFIAPNWERVSYSKALNQSVVGSVNDLVFNAKFCIEEQGMSLWETAGFLNNMPMSYVQEAFPNIAFKEQEFKIRI